MDDKDWVHPAVRRGTWLFTGQAIGFTGGVIYIVFLAVQNPTVERLWWAGLAVIAAVLFWFLIRKMIKNLQHEYRYEEDGNVTSDREATP